MRLHQLLAVGLLLLCAGPLQAAVTVNAIVTPQTPNRGVAQFLQGTDVAGTYKTIYTAGANGSKCYGLWENNTDGSATHLVTVQIVNGGVKYGGAGVTTQFSDGFANSTPAKNLISSIVWPGLPMDSDTNPFFLLVSGDTLQATYATALTASTLINVVAVCADF